MLVSVISDTHRQIDGINEAIKAASDTKILFHLGDNIDDIKIISGSYKGKIVNVKGNCDYSASVPGERIEVVEGKKIFLTHGHNYDVKYDLIRLKYRAIEVGADIVLFGHTHQSLILQEQGIWFINPGSPSLPRDNFKSIAIIDITSSEVTPSIKCIKK